MGLDLFQPPHTEEQTGLKLKEVQRQESPDTVFQKMKRSCLKDLKRKHDTQTECISVFSLFLPSGQLSLGYLVHKPQ